jgi:hypothetical protein
MRIKSFNNFSIFESIDSDEKFVESVCSLYEDIKSIEYILEEKGITFGYRLTVISYLDESHPTQKHIVVKNCEDIKRTLSLDPFLWSFQICSVIRHNSKDYERSVFKTEFAKYYKLLREHLDYVDEKFFTYEAFKVGGSKNVNNIDISISKDFFKG